jgi:hypothetical protein
MEVHSGGSKYLTVQLSALELWFNLELKLYFDDKIFKNLKCEILWVVKWVSTDSREVSSPQLSLSQAKNLVSYLGSHKVKSVIQPC